MTWWRRKPVDLVADMTAEWEAMRPKPFDWGTPQYNGDEDGTQALLEVMARNANGTPAVATRLPIEMTKVRG